MNILYRLLLTTAICISMPAWCTSDKKWPWQRGHHGVTKEKTVIRKHVGERIEIELERGKRDFTWHMIHEPNPDILQLHETDNPKTPFAFSNYEWEYDAIAPGVTWITFEKQDTNNKTVAKKTYKIVIAR